MIYRYTSLHIVTPLMPVGGRDLVAVGDAEVSQRAHVVGLDFERLVPACRIKRGRAKAGEGERARTPPLLPPYLVYRMAIIYC
jgi:hypothetical protein